MSLFVEWFYLFLFIIKSLPVRYWNIFNSISITKKQYWFRKSRVNPFYNYNYWIGNFSFYNFRTSAQIKDPNSSN